MISSFANRFDLLDKKVAGKSKAEQIEARQLELERRLQDVSGQLGSGKKSTKKGESDQSNFYLTWVSVSLSYPTQFVKKNTVISFLIP